MRFFYIWVQIKFIMKNLILTLIIILPLTLWGQGWEKTYYTDNKCYSVQQTNDGGYIFTGESQYINQIGEGDLWLVKTDSYGNIMWEKMWGTTGDDDGSSVQQTNDGGYIITGRTKETDTLSCQYEFTKIWLIKTNSSGDSIWSKKHTGSNIWIESGGVFVRQTFDNGYILLGSNELIKTNNLVDTLWTKPFYYPEEWKSVQQTTDGGYIITGHTQPFGNNNSDVSLIKIDGNGNQQWSQTYGGVFNEWGYSVQQTTDGGYIISGFTNSFGSGESDVYLIKIDSYGNQQWSQTYGGVDKERGESVQQTTDGGYIITGYTESYGNGGRDVYLIKTDGNGNQQWSQTYGGVDWDSGNFVQQTSDGGFIISGNKGTLPYLIKTDGNGNITSTFEIPLPNPNRKLEKTVNLKGQKIKPQTNTPIIEIFDDGSVEKKIVVE